MNPSASGWINKLLKDIESNNKFSFNSANGFYLALRNSGFIYGNNIYIVENYIEDDDFTDEEKCKINLIIALKYIYNEAKTDKLFIERIINFYTEINEYKTSFIGDLLGQKKSSALLEKIIHKRILIENNLISKSFNYFITNALLFVDVLAFKRYLETNSISENYIKNLESAIETIVINVLNSKNNKTEYDASLIKLFEQSVRYQSSAPISYNEAISSINNPLEANYILDMSCMATWGDQKIDKEEKLFINKICEDLNLEKNKAEESIVALTDFYKTHKENIPLLGSKNIVKTFYDNSSKMVSKLISRNGKRLQKEIKESKDLVYLLSQSTVRNLNDEEQKKTQQQLLDIFKTIPSLAIFMLPGGALLLPLVIKFIPKLLPSAFDDNRIED